MSTARRALITALAASPSEGFDAVTLVDQPVPDASALAPHEVLVAVRAANVNWVDLLMFSGQYQHVPEPPYTPGLEWCGEVVATGAAVTAFRAGDKVLADGMRTGPRSLGAYRAHGGFASYALALDEALLPLPAGLDFAEGAALLGGYETAWHALFHRAKLRAGEAVLVLGATGSTGLAAVQLAKRAGAVVIAAGRSPEKLAALREHGADHLLRTVDDAGAPRRFKEDVKALTKGEGAAVVYDALGGEVSTEALRACAFGARFVLVGWSATPLAARGGRDPNALPTNLVLMKSIDVLGSPAVISAHRDPSLRAARLAAVLDEVARGLRPVVSRRFALDELRAALEAKWQSRYLGNVVVCP